ncbi:hypothetical protein [Streptomyces graminilatus]|uniref:hypothetical protein n=1 Tax=Streptomyces graminilatus TaxID=1464070 RepID=UPI0006E380CB|nr:hypothetical protein [Streptomyces graminilatus]
MHLAETAADVEAKTGTARSRSPEADAPAQWHRVLTLLATVSLFIGTRAVWTQAAGHRLVIAAVISLCYLSILVSGVLALTVRRTRSLARLDLCVLVTAVTLTLCTFVMNHAAGDEGVLTAQAARELAAGHPVYGQPWPWLFRHNPHVALTPTANGGYDLTYGYPPLAILLTAPLLWLGHGALAATTVTTGALLVGTVTLWWLLPVPWRSAVTMACLGFGFLPSYARLGYPAILGLALLIPVVVRWTRIGERGRLGWGGLAQAACLGAACAAQQLPWFLAPFLLAGIYAVRRGELGARPAAGVVLRIAAVAATVWLLINTYFIVTEPRTWVEGVALPLTQNATIHGQGLVGIALYYTDGSDRLAWYGHASMLLSVALLALLILFMRRLGPAAMVLPWCAFYLATRSQDGYYLLMTPLWLAAAVTTPAASFAGAWQPRPRFLAGPRRRPALVATAVLLLVPALASAAVAVTGSPPLRMRVTKVLAVRPRAVSELALRITNLDDSALTPHFTLTLAQGMTRWWKVVEGPATLPARGSAVYRLRPPGPVFPVPNRPGTRIRLRVFTESPDTLTSMDVRVPGQR